MFILRNARAFCLYFKITSYTITYEEGWGI